MSTIAPALDRIDWKCSLCGTPRGTGCQCWRKCHCGMLHDRQYACPNLNCERDAADLAADRCCCAAPAFHAKECAQMREAPLKTPCRCACHRGRKLGQPCAVALRLQRLRA